MAGASSPCVRCGQVLDEGAGFCPRCGMPRNEPARDLKAPYPFQAPTARGASPRSRSRHPGKLLALVVGCLAAAVLLLNSRTLIGMVGGAVAPSCTVGLAGAAVSVTVQGLSAQMQCDSLARTTTDGGSWYVYSGGQSATGAVICQVNYADDLFTVRDQGLLSLYGSSVCTSLLKLAGGAQAPQTPQASPAGVPVSGAFAYDPSLGQSLNYQEHQYLYTFIKPCPRAGCETATLDPRFAWTLDWEGPIPPEFQPCLTNPEGEACVRAINGS